MRYLPAVLYHLLPVIPLALGYYYLTAGAVLLVALAYIKVQKLKAQQFEHMQKLQKAGGRPIADESLEKAQHFWERLTFLPQKP